MKKLIVVLMTMGLLLTVTACRTVTLQNVQTSIGPPPSATLQDVAGAIRRAGASLGWVIQENAPGKMTGTLNVRQHQAVVSIRFDKANLQIDYVSSKVLMRSGNKIHHKYNTWVGRLEQRIRKDVGEL